MELYYGATKEGLEGLLKDGIKPKQIKFESGSFAVVPLRTSPKRAILAAFADDLDEVTYYKRKSQPAAAYVALGVVTDRYSLVRWQFDEFWIPDMVRPQDIRAVMELDYASVKLLFKEMADGLGFTESDFVAPLP